jgi:hypothetical protein
MVVQRSGRAGGVLLPASGLLLLLTILGVPPSHARCNEDAGEMLGWLEKNGAKVGGGGTSLGLHHPPQ